MTLPEPEHVHDWVECRRLEFKMTEDPWLPGNFVRAKHGRGMAYDVITARIDGVECIPCGLFIPEAE
jgi:hypothetical protein